jgi:hypothetical protein
MLDVMSRRVAQESQSRRRRSMRAAWAGLLTVPAFGAVWLAGAAEASAAVQGHQGVEIEGAQDRRGFFVGAGLGFGGTFFHVDDFIPSMRTELVLGGGVTKRFTLGANLNVTPYLARNVGVAFGGDIEATGYVWRGFYLRGALGLAGVPKRDPFNPDEKGLSVGLGGAAGAGYEFFLNATAAMSVGITYDARFIPGSPFPRQALLAGLRFTWF